MWSFAQVVYGTDGLRCSSNGASGSTLPSDGKLMQCLRVATCVLHETIPSSSNPASRRTYFFFFFCNASLNLPRSPRHHRRRARRPRQVSFLGFCRLGRPLPFLDARRALRYRVPLLLACVSVRLPSFLPLLISSRAELLKDETSEVDLVGPTLPVLKALCHRGFRFQNGELEVLPKVVNGMLSACLRNIEDVRFVVSRFACQLVLMSASSEVGEVLLSRSRRRITSSPASCFLRRCRLASRLAKRSSSIRASSSLRQLSQTMERCVPTFSILFLADA